AICGPHRRYSRSARRLSYLAACLPPSLTAGSRVTERNEKSGAISPCAGSLDRSVGQAASRRRLSQPWRRSEFSPPVARNFFPEALVPEHPEWLKDKTYESFHYNGSGGCPRSSRTGPGTR